MAEGAGLIGPAARFLAAAGWGHAGAQPLAGDASSRRYLRLLRDDGARAVLMLAPPAPDDGVARFVALAEHLRAAGLSAPEVFDAAPEAGLALLEDLGDRIFGAEITADPSREGPLYTAAVGLLAALAEIPPINGLNRPDAAELAAQIAPTAEWYAIDGTAAQISADFIGALEAPLRAVLAAEEARLVHRDFHAENLVWLPERKGVARLGLLDFQDALLGPPAYDLVSLLQDARRDVSPAVVAACVARYAALTGRSAGELATALAVLGAQRNLRILGIFARLARRDAKPRYLSLLPRVWAHLQDDLADPALAALREAVAKHLRPPDAAHLEALVPQ